MVKTRNNRRCYNLMLNGHCNMTGNCGCGLRHLTRSQPMKKVTTRSQSTKKVTTRSQTRSQEVTNPMLLIPINAERSSTSSLYSLAPSSPGPPSSPEYSPPSSPPSSPEYSPTSPSHEDYMGHVLDPYEPPFDSRDYTQGHRLGSRWGLSPTAIYNCAFSDWRDNKYLSGHYRPDYEAFVTGYQDGVEWRKRYGVVRW